MRDERRIIKRRKFGYYMPVIDKNTYELVGYLSDISPRGFKLDSQKALMVNTNYALRLDLTSEIANTPYIAFVARTIWCRHDPINPNEFIEGFQIISISPSERVIFQRIVEKYGAPESKW